MQYYIFRPATDTPETGAQYPQVQKMRPGYNYKAANSVHALSRAYQDLPDFEPDLDYFILHGKAKLSDLLSVAMVHGGFLISERLKNIFEQFTLPTHKFYPAKVLHKKTLHENYYWMHIICNLTDYVDYKRSTFFIYHNYAHNLGYVEVGSKDEYEQMKEKVKKDNPGKTVTIWADKIYLTNVLEKKLDLLEVGAFNANHFISTPLREAVLQEKITGCDITAAANLFVE